MHRIVFFLTIFLFMGFTQATDLFIPDEIYVQFRNELDVDSEGHFELISEIIQLFSATSILEIHPVFPKPKLDNRLPGMEKIYRIKVNNTEYLDKTVQSLAENTNIVYAERIPVRKMFEVPNDPLWTSQYHLQLLQVDSARGIHTGDSSIAIAVIDGGVNYLHEDLHSDIWVNHAEDIDGDGFLSPADNDSIDEDGNGFIDDVIGWDFVNLPGQGFAGEDDSLADNDPMDFGGHGTHCAGDASAVTNNGVGIASVGGDCRIMCIRAGMTASNGFGYIYYSIEGIYYAANNGARVISMSYGGDIFSSTEQIAIDYAYNQGVICVAAAGNDNSNIPQYPANYNHVVAVAATDAQDLKADFSNYGSWIDLCAPGVAILSTLVGGGYGNQGGTSMSTPIVAGLAGLTSAMFPQYTNAQVVDRILTSCDNIDTLNPQYAGQLGAGRANAYKTLDKAVRLYSTFILDSVSGNNNGRLDYNETSELVITLKNTYDDVTNVSATITTLNPILTIIDSSSIFGNMQLGSFSSNENDPFMLTVGADTNIAFASIKINIIADGGGYQYQKILELPIGQRDILIVNDDQPIGSSKIGYYLTALDSLQKSFDIWDVQSQGTPGINERSYSTIIWYTGEAEQNVLTTEEQSFLENYLDSGGKLFLTGQNIAYDLVEQQNGLYFFENYLHASYVQNSSSDYSLQGLVNDPIGAGEIFIILGSGGANNQNSPDVVTAISPAQPAILYEEGNQTDQAAIYYSAYYRLVYFAFGWEGINDQGPAKREAVLQRVLNWLDTVTDIEEERNLAYSQLTLYPNYPNPFNPTTKICFVMPNNDLVKLDIFNNIGQKVRSLLNQDYSIGIHEVIWDGKNDNGQKVSAGVYYYRLKTSNRQQIKKMLLLK